VLCYGPSMLL